MDKSHFANSMNRKKEGECEKKSTVRLISWNVNGLRAILKRLSMKNVLELIRSLERCGLPSSSLSSSSSSSSENHRFSLSLACFQETKLTVAELIESLACPSGYHAYFSMCKGRKANGYSGVVTYSRTPPIASEEGITGVLVPASAELIGAKFSKEIFANWSHSEKLEIDSEGRCVMTDHVDFVLINTYCPAITIDPQENMDKFDKRVKFKQRYLRAIYLRVKALRRDNREVILVGDLNVSHSSLDVAWSTVDHSSFSRIWLKKLLNQLGFVDAYRHFHPRQRRYTHWNQVTGARKTNYGSRIDYILMSAKVAQKACNDCGIWDDILGSDHCPVFADIAVLHHPKKEQQHKSESSSFKAPTVAECAYTGRFSGQKRISSYFTKKGSSSSSSILTTNPQLLSPSSQSLSSSLPLPPSLAETAITSKPSSSSSSSLPLSRSSSSWTCETCTFVNNADNIYDYGGDDKVAPFLIATSHGKHDNKCQMCKRSRWQLRKKRKSLIHHQKREQQSSILTFFGCSTTSLTLDGDATAAPIISTTKKKLKTKDDSVDKKKKGRFSDKKKMFSRSESISNDIDHSGCAGEDSTIREFRNEIIATTHTSSTSTTISNSAAKAIYSTTAAKKNDTASSRSNLDKGRTRTSLSNQHHFNQLPLLPDHSISSTSYEYDHSQRRRHRLSESQKAWRNVLHGRGPPAPRCKSHNLVCLLRTVLKRGPNKGRKFYVCPLPNGKPGQKGARCNFFSWATATGKPLLTKDDSSN